MHSFNSVAVLEHSLIELMKDLDTGSQSLSKYKSRCRSRFDTGIVCQPSVKHTMHCNPYLRLEHGYDTYTCNNHSNVQDMSAATLLQRKYMLTPIAATLDMHLASNMVQSVMCNACTKIASNHSIASSNLTLLLNKQQIRPQQPGQTKK